MLLLQVGYRVNSKEVTNFAELALETKSIETQE